MPCNAIATATAMISVTEQIKNLKAEQIATAVAMYLKNKYGDKVRLGNFWKQDNKSGAFVQFTMSIDYNIVQVTISGGQVEMESSYLSRSELKPYVKDLGDFLNKAAGVAMQTIVAQRVKALKGIRVTNQSKASNGSIVLNVEL